MKRKLYIAACPRSGTKYAAELWSALGLPVGHEYTANGGTSTHYFVSPAINRPLIANKLPKGRCIHQGEHFPDFEFEHVFHQTRHPLLVIGSMQWIPGYTAMLKAHRIKPPKARVARAAVTWWLFNRLAHSQATYQYRIEDIDDELPKLCDRLGVPYPGSTPPISRTTNTEQKYKSQFLHDGGVFWGSKAKKAARIDGARPVDWSMLRVLLDSSWTSRLQQAAELYGYDITHRPDTST